MNSSARLLRLAACVAVILHSFTLSAASLWFGDKDGLHRIDTAANQVVLNVAFQPAVGIAVNSADGSVWAMTQDRLAHLSEQGVVLSSLSLHDLANATGAPRQLVMNPNDGTLWAAFENRVLHVDASGAVLQALPVSARDLAVGQDGSLWILSDTALEQRNSLGALVRSVILPARMKHLALDDAGGVLWVSGEKDLLQLSLASPDQLLLSVLVPETTSAISTDMQTGDLWVLGQNTLFAYGRDGHPHVSRDLRDFSIANPQTLLFDFSSQAAWVGHQQGITRLTVAGTVASTFTAATQVGAIAIGRTAVSITPVVSIVAPANGAVVNSGTPQFTVGYDALCGAAPCGFPNSFYSSFTLSALINGIENGSSFVFDANTGRASFTPAARLPEGANTFSARVTDSFGQASSTVTSTFTIDTIAPSFSGVLPATGTTFSNAAITITGGVDDSAATVTLGGQTQGSSFTFPVTLTEGANTFTLVARDAAGNTRSLALSYTYEPPNVPPSVTITAPPNGTTFTAPASFSVTANAVDSDGTIARVDFFSNGVIVGSDNTAPYAVSLANLGIGTYVLTAQATDNRGGVTMSNPVSVTVGAPNVPPTVQLTSPAANATYFAPATVNVAASASDSDGTIVRVELLSDGVVAATVTAAPYTATLTGIAAGTHTITARAYDDRGAVTTSGAVTITVNALSIFIDSPLPNAATIGDTLLVRGHIIAPPNSGVLVNESVAAVDATGSYAVVIPVAPNANTITATVTTFAGATASQTINISASGSLSQFIVTATPTSGFAPLVPTFTITNPLAVNAIFTFDGFGPFSLPSGSSVQLNVTYQAGVYAPAIVISGNGFSFTHRIVINAIDRTKADETYRSLWSGMNAALAAGDKDTAMRYLTADAQAKYGPAFDSLLPYMSEIVASYSPIAQSSVAENYAEYGVTRLDGTTKRLYLIYFLRDASGVWRIDGM